MLGKVTSKGLTYEVYGDNTATVINISESGLEDSKKVEIPNTITYSGKTISVTNFCLSGGDKLETCSSVTTMTIPSSLKNFVPGSFEDNVSFVKQLPNLKYFNIDSGNQCFSDYHNQLLLSKDKTTLICCPPGATASLTDIRRRFKNIFWQNMNKESLIFSFIPNFAHRVCVQSAITTSGYKNLTIFIENYA